MVSSLVKGGNGTPTFRLLWGGPDLTDKCSISATPYYGHILELSQGSKEHVNLAPLRPLIVRTFIAGKI